MQINSNSVLNQNVYLNANQSLNRIATGIELNQSSDNASSLSISNSLLAQSNGYGQALENANSAIAATQIASGATTEQSNILNNVKEKLLQASTDTTSQEGRDAILKDIQKQLDSIFINIQQEQYENLIERIEREINTKLGFNNIKS